MPLGAIEDLRWWKMQRQTLELEAVVGTRPPRVKVPMICSEWRVASVWLCRSVVCHFAIRHSRRLVLRDGDLVLSAVPGRQWEIMKSHARDCQVPFLKIHFYLLAASNK